MIQLYSCGSPNVMKVLFMLGETGLPYETRYVNIAAVEQYEPWFVALNPNSKLPVIVDSDGPEGSDGKPFTVIESGAILVYLAEKSGQFFGKSAAERSVILQWLMLQMSGIGPTFGQAVHFTNVAPQAGNEYSRTRYYSEAVRLCEVLDARLKDNEFLGGKDFSIADIATFPWLWRYPKQIGVDLSGMPALERWRAAIEARPGFQKIRDEAVAVFKRGLEMQRSADPDKIDRFFLRGRWARKPAERTK
jgi:GST-like protein